MSTLLLRLAAPLQSWGSDSKFDIRSTVREPTKSGVIGMLAAALGIRRDDKDALKTLSLIKFGVRADREGSLLRDFHMAHELKYWETLDGKYAHLTTRYYLCDAVFLCGLEADDETLNKLSFALTHPVYPLFLGRRSCPPTLPLVLGIRDACLETALTEEPRLVVPGKSEKETPMRIVTDAAEGGNGTAIAKDLPISFDPFRREFGYRKYRETILPAKQNDRQTEHDPFAELEADDVSDQNGA